VSLEISFVNKLELVSPSVLTVGASESLHGRFSLIMYDQSIISIGFGDINSLIQPSIKIIDVIHVDNAAARLANDLIDGLLEGYQFLAYGAEFQLSVWTLFLLIKRGETCHYIDIANKLNKSTAACAVGNAIAQNPLAVVILCHRVMPYSLKLGGYRWGQRIKKLLLNIESGGIYG